MILHALPQQSEVQVMCLLLSSKIIKISQRMCVEAHNYTATCNLQVSESHQGIQVSVMSTSPVYYSSPVIMMATLICTELYLLWIWHQKTDCFSDSVPKLHGAWTSCEFLYFSMIQHNYQLHCTCVMLQKMTHYACVMLNGWLLLITNYASRTDESIVMSGHNPPTWIDQAMT